MTDKPNGSIHLLGKPGLILPKDARSDRVSVQELKHRDTVNKLAVGAQRMAMAAQQLAARLDQVAAARQLFVASDSTPESLEIFLAAIDGALTSPEFANAKD